MLLIKNPGNITGTAIPNMLAATIATLKFLS